jgi:hypothetical protein
MNWEQAINKLDNFIVTKKGIEAFEDEHRHCIVLFMTDGVYWYWTPEPRDAEDFYNTGIPDFIEIGYDSIDEAIKMAAYELPELAKQVEAEFAWGFDL